MVLTGAEGLLFSFTEFGDSSFEWGSESVLGFSPNPKGAIRDAEFDPLQNGSALLKREQKGGKGSSPPQKTEVTSFHCRHMFLLIWAGLGGINVRNKQGIKLQNFSSSCPE